MDGMDVRQAQRLAGGRNREAGEIGGDNTRQFRCQYAHTADQLMRDGTPHSAHTQEYKCASPHQADARADEVCCKPAHRDCKARERVPSVGALLTCSPGTRARIHSQNPLASHTLHLDESMRTSHLLHGQREAQERQRNGGAAHRAIRERERSHL